MGWLRLLFRFAIEGLQGQRGAIRCNRPAWLVGKGEHVGQMEPRLWIIGGEFGHLLQPLLGLFEIATLISLDA